MPRAELVYSVARLTAGAPELYPNMQTGAGPAAISMRHNEAPERAPINRTGGAA
jgi:hypothetical protein